MSTIDKAKSVPKKNPAWIYSKSKREKIKSNRDFLFLLGILISPRRGMGILALRVPTADQLMLLIVVCCIDGLNTALKVIYLLSDTFQLQTPLRHFNADGSTFTI